MRSKKGRQKRHNCRTIMFFVLGGALALLALLQLAPNFVKGLARADLFDNPYASQKPSDEIQHSISDNGDGHLKLLLSTHNRLFWYVPATGKELEVHHGHGVYYGCFSGESSAHSGPPGSVWVVSRPHNWHPKDTEEAMLHLELPSGEELERKRLPTRFTHDAIRVDESVYVCDTGEGKVVELDFPSMTIKRMLNLFTPREHVNTIAAFGDGTLWAVLHNLGESLLAQIDLAAGKVIRRIPKVGVNSHGLVLWQGLFVMLSSKDTKLITVDPETEEVSTVWQGNSGFLKGLIVVDDVAYFGKSPPLQRQDRDGPKVQCDLVAVDLLEKKLLFVHKVDTRGLLNIISAPQLSIASTFIAQKTRIRTDSERAVLSSLHSNRRAIPRILKGTSGGAVGIRENAVEAEQEEFGASNELESAVKWAESWLTQPMPVGTVAGHWSTGMPYMSLAEKGVIADTPRAGGWGWKAPRKKRTNFQSRKPYLHLGRVPQALLQPLKARLEAMPPDWWDPKSQVVVNANIDGREKNLASTKPGVASIYLLFSTRSADRVWQLPLYSYFEKELLPVVTAMVGSDALQNILRLQLALMRPQSHIRPHRDTGEWANQSHRIHVVIKTHGGVVFTTCPECQQLGADIPECRPPPNGRCVPIDTGENSVFEVDNLYVHEVTNRLPKPRVHLVIDVAEKAVPERHVLKVGQVCRYAASLESAHFTPGC